MIKAFINLINNYQKRIALPYSYAPPKFELIYGDKYYTKKQALKQFLNDVWGIFVQNMIIVWSKIFNPLNLYLKLIWSDNSFFPSTNFLNLSPSNSFSNYTYRLKITYSPEKNKNGNKKNNKIFYNNKLKILI